jgi:hypothetical protein
MYVAISSSKDVYILGVINRPMLFGRENMNGEEKMEECDGKQRKNKE